MGLQTAIDKEPVHGVEGEPSPLLIGEAPPGRQRSGPAQPHEDPRHLSTIEGTKCGGSGVAPEADHEGQGDGSLVVRDFEYGNEGVGSTSCHETWPTRETKDRHFWG